MKKEEKTRLEIISSLNYRAEMHIKDVCDYLEDKYPLETTKLLREKLYSALEDLTNVCGQLYILKYPRESEVCDCVEPETSCQSDI